MVVKMDRVPWGSETVEMGLGRNWRNRHSKAAGCFLSRG